MKIKDFIGGLVFLFGFSILNGGTTLWWCLLGFAIGLSGMGIMCYGEDENEID